MYLSCTITAPSGIREFTAVDLADFDRQVARVIDRFADRATDPSSDPGETWDIIQFVHVGHESCYACTTACQTSLWLTLGPVHEVRAAIAGVDSFFAEHPPVEAEISNWLVRGVGTASDGTILCRLVAP
jgi:hypothetical protein